MRFIETTLSGAWVIEPEPVMDERGWFARTFDADLFAERGLDSACVQCNASFNTQRDTLRGMHFQEEPHGEPKLVKCVRGAIFDVAVDLRRDSVTHCRWHPVELSAKNGRSFYIPRGMAHGFQTLTDNCEVHYQMGARYVSAAARGVRWNDPAFGIEWPDTRGGRIVSRRDASYPDYEP